MLSNGIVLVVEDSEKLNTANARALKMRGYDVHTALTLAEARENLSQAEPDIILLDVMLPDGDGFEFCEEIKGKTQARVIFLTAKTDVEDRVHGLEIGGDDYIVKPFHPREMLARVDAAMRRQREKISVKKIEKGNLSLDIVASRAYASGTDLLLTPKEFALLHLLIKNEGKLMSAETLYKEVWGQDMGGDDRTLRPHVSKLRDKMEANKCNYTVNMVYGKGYCFENTQSR